MQLLNITLTPKEMRALTKAIVTYAGVITAHRDVGMASTEAVNADLDALNSILENMNSVVGTALEYQESLSEGQEDK